MKPRWRPVAGALLVIGLVLAKPSFTQAQSRIQPNTAKCDQNLRSSAGNSWTFSGNRGNLVTIFLFSDDFDPVLELHQGSSSSGQLLITDDDSGPDLSALIEGFELPETGEFTAVVSGQSSKDAGIYSLSVRVDTPSQSHILSLGSTGISALSNPEGDIWRFTGNLDNMITISLNSSQFDPILELRNSANRVLAEDDDGGDDQDSLLSYKLPESGQYTIVARGLQPDVSGGYTLGLYSSSAENELTSGTVIRTMLQNPSGDRWTYTATGQTIQIAMFSEDIDTLLELYDRTGDLVADDDDSGTDTNSLIRTRVNPNTTYTIVARSFSNISNGRYSITVLECR